MIQQLHLYYQANFKANLEAQVKMLICLSIDKKSLAKQLLVQKGLRFHLIGSKQLTAQISSMQSKEGFMQT